MMHKKLASLLQIGLGDKAYVRVDVSNLIANLRTQACELQTVDANAQAASFCSNLTLAQNQLILIPLQLAKIVDKGYGKFKDSEMPSKIVVEHRYLMQYVAQYWARSAADAATVSFRSEISTKKPDEFVGQIIANIKDRIKIYLDSNYDRIQLKLTDLASNLAYDLGVYPFTMTLPVLQELYNSKYAAMFLGIVLNLIIFILFCLSLMLLYNLLLVSIETKMFELAVLRVLGLNKIGIVCLIIIQALSYVIPAIIAGLCLSLAVLNLISGALYSSMQIRISIVPTPNAFALAICVGLLIPLFSSIFPIRVALSQTLNLALDVNRSKSQAVKITIDTEEGGVPWGRLQFALITSMFGISIYYFLPLSLLSFNMGLMITIFFWILIGLLIGLIILSMNVQYLMERLVVYSCLFWTGNATMSLVLKNLASHRIKNRRTAIMYGLSIAFIIFIWTAATVQLSSSDYQVRQQQGTLLNLQSTTITTDSESYSYQIPVLQTEEFIQQHLSGYVVDYSWVTYQLYTILRNYGL